MSVKLPSAREVAEAVNAHGITKTAQMLGTSAPTICRMLKKHGYQIQRVYVLPPEAEAIIKQQKVSA